MASISGGNLASSLLYTAFFFSGFTALLYEILWQRLLVRITGATMPATVAIFSLFMLGLALGSFFSIKSCEKSIRAWKMYALCELTVAIFGILILYLSEQSTLELIDAYLSASSGLVLVRAHLVFFFAFLASVAVTMASSAMGAAFNFGIRALLLQRAEIPSFCQDGQVASTVSSIDLSIQRTKVVNQAYIWNICGAALGSISGAFFFLPSLGLTTTAFFTCVLSILLAVGLFLGQEKSKSDPSDESQPLEREINYSTIMLALIFSLSFVSMSLEVTWTRLFSLICGSSTYAIGSVLAAILFALAAAAVSSVRIRGDSPSFYFSVLNLCAGGAALCLSVSLLFLPYMAWAVLWMQNLIASFSLTGGFQFFLPRILLSFVSISGTIFCLGLGTPLAIKFANKEQQSVRVTAYILTLSTAGSICGALFTAFFIIPNSHFVSGIETSMIMSIYALSLLALVSLKRSLTKFNLKSLSMGCWTVAFSFFIIVIHPNWQPRLMSLGPSFAPISQGAFLSFAQFKKRYGYTAEKCLFYKEGSSATVTVESNEPSNVIYLKNNGKVESALPIDWRKPAPTSDYKTQLFMSIVPVLCQGKRLNYLNALTIGFGSGITSGLLLSFRQISHLTTCEIEPVIYHCSHFFDVSNFRPLRKEWLENGRVKPECADARAYLNQNSALFDIIVSQPSEPWVSGSSDLFTLEFFRLAKSKMNSGGVFVQWLQLYCIDNRLLTNLIGTFQHVFNHTYILHPRNSGDVILVGVLDEKLRPESFLKNISSDLSESGMSSSVLETLNQTAAVPGRLLDYDFILTPADVASYLSAQNEVQINTDGLIATEYQLPQELMLTEADISKNIERLKSARARR